MKLSNLIFFTLHALLLHGQVLGEELFSASPSGELRTNTGSGRHDRFVYAPGIRFPLEASPAYANSQVHSLGGYWSHPSNYEYPWWDNFCETRGWRTPLCPGGKGHQGQDIRPADKTPSKYWVVAVEDGQIVHVSQPPGWMVTLKGAQSGNRYNYLHLNMAKLAVKLGDKVVAGQRIGLVSNDFGGSKTSVHLHFEIQQAQKGQSGLIHVPPYASLIEAYQRLIEGN